MIPLKHVFKELFSERTRILLTVLAIAWGTASITIMLALGEGLRLTFGRAMLGMGNGILVVSPGQTSKAYGGLPEGIGEYEHPIEQLVGTVLSVRSGEIKRLKRKLAEVK